jgi:class 3 adenylate cyclase
VYGQGSFREESERIGPVLAATGRITREASAITTGFLSPGEHVLKGFEEPVRIWELRVGQ